MSGCETCPLGATKRAVPSFGPADADICVVGMAPGANELLKGQPFVGRAGQILRSTLKGCGIDPNAVFYANALSCRPPKDAPTSKMIAACRPRLFEELQKVRPKKILVVGGAALESVLQADSSVPITRWRGMGMMLPISPDWSAYAVPSFHPAAVLRDDDLFRDFLWDVDKLARCSAPQSEPEIDYVVCRSEEEALECLAVIETASILSCDLETTGFDFMRDAILGVGFGALTESNSGYVVIIPSDLLSSLKIREAIRYLVGGGWDGRLVFHNIKFDIQFLQSLLGSSTGSMTPLRPAHPADTMLMRYAQDERPGAGDEEGGVRYRTHGLKDIVRARYDIPDYHFDFQKFLSTPEEERDWEAFYRYHSMDCYFTLRVYDDLLQELNEESPALMTLVDDVLIPGALAFADIERYGAPIDREYLENLRTEVESTLDDLRGYLVGVAITAGFEGEFNPRSWPNLHKLLFDLLKIPTKRRSTDREVLQALRDVVSESKRKVIDAVLQFRQLDKVLGTYINGILQRLGTDGRVRSDFLMHGTATGRLASRDPNLQNIPILMGKQIRNAFRARPGWVLGEADYSQLELRIAAWYSRDPVLLKAYRDGKDIHRLVASTIFHKPEETIVWLERYMAKYVDFGIIYGRGGHSLATGWEMKHLVELGGKAWTVREAERFIDDLLASWHGLRDWMKLQAHLCLTRGYTETPMGRRRRFPLITQDLVPHIERKSVNTPIQSLASDLCTTAVIRLHRRLDPEKARILFPVHDAIFFEIRDDCIREISQIIREEMEQNVPIEAIIPFPIDLKTGERWGELEEEVKVALGKEA